MYVVCVTIHVLPGSEAEFVAATRLNHANTRREAGNLRFDLLQKEGGTSQFFLYEAYRTAKDFSAHQRTPHYLQWKEAVAPMMAEPRQGVRHTSLLPADADW